MEDRDKMWCPIAVEELFSRIEATKGTTTDQLVKGDDVPYIAAAKGNNGYMFMCSAKNNPEWISQGNAIVFVQLGDGAAGIAHYVPMNFIGMTGKTSCGYNPNLTPMSGVFISKCLSKNKAQFSHGYSWTGKRLLKTKVMLPVTSNKLPDWKYMSSFVKSIKEKLLLCYKKYIEKQLFKLQYKDIPALEEMTWSPFMISDVFHILSGTRLVAANSSEGTRPFIGALDNSNGIARFVSNTNESLDKNVLGVNYNGNGMGIGFYHPYECIFTDDVKRFHLKNHEDNKYILLFMKVAILMQKQKFGYLYKFNAKRMAHTKILLPVINGKPDKPDYAYMEQYAKNMMLRKYQQYLSYLKKRERNQKRDSGVIPNKRKRSFEEIDLDEDYSHDLWMERVKDAIAYRKAHGMIKEEGETPKVAPALSNDPVLADRPKLRAGWDDCDISDSAWERFVQKRENRSQKEK